MRYVTSMRLVDRQVLVMTLVAVILSVSILILVYISNIYFVRSIVDPVKNITGKMCIRDRHEPARCQAAAWGWPSAGALWTATTARFG